jgi:UDP-glucose 4-epimerase
MMRVALTGPTGDFGALLLPRLRDDARVSRIVTLGTRGSSGPRVVHHRVDLTRYDVESELVDLLREAEVDVLFHLAFLHGRTRSGAFAHEVEVIGTLHVLAAAARAGVKKLVVPSYTLVYGARPDNPALLGEEAPLHGSAASRFVSDRVEVEKQVAAFRTAHPEVAVTVLRFAPVLGPTADNPATRFFRRPVAPTLLGFDPLWQALHEEDACAALLHVLDRPSAGVFNVVSADVLPLSAMIGLAGSRALPLPAPLARAILRGLNAAGVTATPPSLLDYLHYACVADGARCRELLDFVPRHSARDALQALRA